MAKTANGFLDDTHCPRYGEQDRLPLDYEPDKDDGVGL